MSKEELISKKVRVFKFDNNEYKYGYVDKMDEHIREVGIIKDYNSVYNAFRVYFENDNWLYPAELIEQYLVEEINHVKIISNKEILNERIEKTKNTLAYSAALYQDGVILSNQIAIMEALIAIQDTLINKASQSDKVNEKDENENNK
jgi:hypothetical protein